MVKILLGLTVLAFAAPAGSRPVTFDQAKADKSKRLTYLGELLGKLVYDKEKNPKGVVQGWYYLPDTAQNEAAQKAIRAEFKKDGRDFYFKRDIKGILESVKPAAFRITPFYRKGLFVASQEQAGILLVGDIFSLESEEDVKAILEDYAIPYIKNAEDGIMVGEREIDTTLPAIEAIAYKLLIRYVAQSHQVENILSGKRKVSDSLKKEALKEYLQYHQAYCKEVLKQKKIYDDNNENTLQKEILDQLAFLRDFTHKRVKKTGHNLKLVNKATQEHKLEKK